MLRPVGAKGDTAVLAVRVTRSGGVGGDPLFAESVVAAPAEPSVIGYRRPRARPHCGVAGPGGPVGRRLLRRRGGGVWSRRVAARRTLVRAPRPSGRTRGRGSLARPADPSAGAVSPAPADRGGGLLAVPADPSAGAVSPDRRTIGAGPRPSRGPSAGAVSPDRRTRPWRASARPADPSAGAVSPDPRTRRAGSRPVPADPHAPGAVSPDPRTRPRSLTARRGPVGGRLIRRPAAPSAPLLPRAANPPPWPCRPSPVVPFQPLLAAAGSSPSLRPVRGRSSPDSAVAGPPPERPRPVTVRLPSSDHVCPV